MLGSTQVFPVLKHKQPLLLICCKIVTTPCNPTAYLCCHSATQWLQPHHFLKNTCLYAEDAESKQVHLNGVIIRDLSSVVSNYRSKFSLDEYLKGQNVRGIANVDTRAITRRLRDSGNLNGVITSDSSKSDEELVEMAKSWNIVGQDLISGISIKEPYEWKDPTVEEWEFSAAVKNRNGTEPLHVCSLPLQTDINWLRSVATPTSRCNRNDGFQTSTSIPRSGIVSSISVWSLSVLFGRPSAMKHGQSVLSCLTDADTTPEVHMAA